MAHTLLEQSIDLDGATSCVDTVHDLFAQQFGYTKNGDYYYSPVDSNFGVRCYVEDTLTYTNICVTFDGGDSEINVAHIINLFYDNVRYYPNTVYYHVSKSEKVICLRFKYLVKSNVAMICALIIAHDDINKTICFMSDNYSSTPSAAYHDIYMMDSRKLKIQINDNTKLNLTQDVTKVSKYLSNSIYRYPAHADLCMFSELYGINSLHEFDYTYLPSYINFNGMIYRIVSMSNIRPSDTIPTNSLMVSMPYFAFPVSD